MRDPISFTVVIPFDFVLMLALLLLIALTGMFVALRKVRAIIADVVAFGAASRIAADRPPSRRVAH